MIKLTKTQDVGLTDNYLSDNIKILKLYLNTIAPKIMQG